MDDPTLGGGHGVQRHRTAGPHNLLRSPHGQGLQALHPPDPVIFNIDVDERPRLKPPGQQVVDQKLEVGQGRPPAADEHPDLVALQVEGYRGRLEADLASGRPPDLDRGLQAEARKQRPNHFPGGHGQLPFRLVEIIRDGEARGVSDPHPDPGILTPKAEDAAPALGHNEDIELVPGPPQGLLGLSDRLGYTPG